MVQQYQVWVGTHTYWDFPLMILATLRMPHEQIWIYHAANPSTSMPVQTKSVTTMPQHKLKLDNSVLHRRYYILQWSWPHWMCCPNITVILFYYCDIYLYANFPGSHFATFARSSRIPLHKNSLLLILNSTFFVSIIIITKTGEC